MQGYSKAPSNVARVLKGIDFPCAKPELLAHCRRNRCTSDVVRVLESLPDRHYTSMADVIAGIGRLE